MEERKLSEMSMDDLLEFVEEHSFDMPESLKYDWETPLENPRLLENKEEKEDTKNNNLNYYFWDTSSTDKWVELYSFEIWELIWLKKHLKSKIVNQDEVIEKYVSNFMLNIYRNENNKNNLWVFVNIWPSWSGKNYVIEQMRDYLDFAVEVIDCSQYHYVELSSLMWATDWYSSWTESLMESIYDKAKGKDKKIFLIFDEIEKAQTSENWNFSTFLNSIMNIIWTQSWTTKNNSTKLFFSNFVFIFNTNIWFDSYKTDIQTKRIGFDIWEVEKKEKEYKLNIKDFEYLLKHKFKINVSTFNRLKKGDNFIIFNEMNKEIFKKFAKRKYYELLWELINNFWPNPFPTFEDYISKFKKIDLTKGFRWLNEIIFTEIKLDIIKNIVYKDYFTMSANAEKRLEKEKKLNLN